MPSVRATIDQPEEPLSKRGTVYLDVWTGDPSNASKLVEARYPGAKVVEVNHRQLRQARLGNQIRLLRSLKGDAIIFYFNSFRDSKYTEFLRWSGLLHSCRETVLVDRYGEFQIHRRRDWFWLFPKTGFVLLLDLSALVLWWVYLKWILSGAHPPDLIRPRGGFVAYLFPYCLHDVHSGGAASHIRGFLGGLAENHTACRIFTGTELPVDLFPQNLIPAPRSWFVLWEAVSLSYNSCFARQVRDSLRRERPAFLYQRHGRFSISGAILARQLGVPLVLEYNASEVWVSNSWDPARFFSWLKMGEEIALRSATIIAATSDASRDELLKFGVPAHRILVNPNGVNPRVFTPECGGEQLRSELGIRSNEVVVGFVGSFSFWHGIEVMQQGIAKILNHPGSQPIRFLLVGEGPLYPEMRTFLKTYEATGQVIFTGVVPHEKVPMYLDATDILVSPHVPNRDGTPFFGSPTKLFEYMAMGKAIAASSLDQLARVLTHNETAILAIPGSVEGFVEAVRLLASDRELRQRLGRRVREVATERYTWARNAANVVRFAEESIR